tara:strand:+ start:11041 stop:11928 length:888 start_codon:yes stop_codon:yes gene_type:complete
MYKIGFLGSDNSHVEKFCEILNLSNHKKYWAESGVKVTGIWGEDKDLTKKMATYGEIDKIETSPENLVTNSDIVFVITRQPEKHFEYAKFAIDQKKPLFVEKPVTQTVSEAKKLIDLVKKSNIIMTSFSTLRFSSDTQNHINQLNKIGPLTYGNYLGPASKYKSLLFYGIHIIELMLHIHGDEIELISAVEHPRNAVESNVQALCQYKNGSLISLSFIGKGVYQFQMTGLSKNGVVNTQINSDDFYEQGMKKLIPVLTNKEKNPVSFDQMIRSIQIAEAIEVSLKNGEAVNPKDL